jgi:hypothetical protein
MATRLERYMAGEQQAVWEELGALGAAVREEPYYADALAVASETMRRAHHNIELLVARLHAVGFCFGPYEWDTPAYQALLRRRPDAAEANPEVFVLPKPNVQEQIAEVERLGGVLPLSLRAWYEHIGSVCLVGNYPVADPAAPGGFTNNVQYRQARRQARGTDDLSSAEEWLAENEHDLDPLYVNPIEHTLQNLRQWGKMYGDRQPVVVIAPDEFFKNGISGGGSYDIRLPSAGADARLEGEWHRTTFVKYLRMCFVWGGFPGLGAKKRPPVQELEHLTNGLLPI